LTSVTGAPEGIMADWHESKDALIKAAPDDVFAVVGDFLRHRDLAG
jgi:hypothetical protein